MTGCGVLSERVVIGRGSPAPGAHTALAIRLAVAARALGFRSASVISSRVRGSNSRYVMVVDPVGRGWKIRVSNHFRPRDAPTPLFDLVSRDGVAGFDEARGFLARVAAGEVRWFDHRATGRRLSQHQREKWGRP